VHKLKNGRSLYKSKCTGASVLAEITVAPSKQQKVAWQADGTDFQTGLSNAVKISCQPSRADDKLWVWKKSPANSVPLLKPTRPTGNFINHCCRNSAWKCSAI
jgi:hypothetical protein